MARNVYKEVRPLIVRLDSRSGRTVGFQFVLNGWNTSCTTLGQIQLLQELTKSAVTITARTQ